MAASESALPDTPMESRRFTSVTSPPAQAASKAPCWGSARRTVMRMPQARQGKARRAQSHTTYRRWSREALLSAPAQHP